MASATYRFSEFRLDPARRELWRDDEEVSLPPKAFGCLTYLVEHRDRAVGREELIDAVWGKENLADTVLSHAILAARRGLDDRGDEHHFIKTVQGFGYRWVAPVEVETAEEPAAAASRRRPLWLWMVLAILAVGALVLGTTYLSTRGEMRGAGRASWQVTEGDIALLLPVTSEAKGNHSWIRFGVMELIAERLRAAGQPMVPSETVIALMRDLPDEPNSEGLDSLASTTGAHIVLGARAESTGTRWRVSIRSLNGGSPPVTALAEAEDVLEAARVAADRLALSLGLAPAPEPDTEPGLAALLRRSEAAVLAQQMDVARELIESADSRLRERPEVRLQSAWIDYHSHQLDRAHTGFESLLKEPASNRDPLLRARALYGLAGVHYQRNDHGAAEAILEESVRLLDQESKLDMLGQVRRSLGLVTLRRGKLEVARTHFARARRAYMSSGDTVGLSSLDNNQGLLMALQERYAEALYYFKNSANVGATLGDIGSELRNRANQVEILLGLLEPRTALTLNPRLTELVAQTTNPALIAQGNLARAALLAANGQCQGAERLLSEELRRVETRDDLPGARTWALVLRAEQLASAGSFAQAARVADKVVEQVPPLNDVLLDDYLGRAWLILLRTHLHEGELTIAAEIATAMANWVERSPTPAPKIYAMLARAELAAAGEQTATAETAFESALTLADSGQVPIRVLQVAESYVPWLLGIGPHGVANPDRALVVVDHLARYADQDYGTALIPLRVYHVLGPPSAWRAALDRVQSLAGEREIPPELLVAPQTTQH